MQATEITDHTLTPLRNSTNMGIPTSGRVANCNVATWQPRSGYDDTQLRWIAEGKCITCGSSDLADVTHRYGVKTKRKARRCKKHTAQRKAYKLKQKRKLATLQQ